MSTLPLRPGRPEDYRALREWLAAVGYTAAGICARAQVPTLLDFPTRADGRTTVTEAGDALDLLIGLFLDGGRVPPAVLEQRLPCGVRDSLERLGLVAPVHAQPEDRAATVSLYPVEWLYIASDLTKRAAGVYLEEELEPRDFVFSAITPLTGTFLENVPTTPCGRLLELCSGTAAPALLGASRAEGAWAVDITERSTQVARFNAQLNGVTNFTALEGDLYEPVRGLTFDRILAHPPYVPAPEIGMIYRDGGPDGEDILRRILGGLPEHLAPGGCFYGTFRATDRVGAPLEDRLRAMIGEGDVEFDLVLMTHYQFHPTEFFFRAATAGRLPFSVLEARHRMYRQLEAEHLVYASVMLQRHERPREPFTLRRARGPAAGWRDVEWLRWWGTQGSTGAWLPLLLDARPVLSAAAELDLHYGFERGEWTMRACEVRSGQPFPRTLRVAHAMAGLLAAYDGSRTVREQLAELRAAGALPAEVSDEAFLAWLRELVLDGVLEIGAGPAITPRPSPDGAERARPDELVELARSEA